MSKKPKKKNMLKRQQNKKKKREKELKSRKPGQRAPSLSFSKAKKYLGELQYLIFEPEIEAVKFEAAELERLNNLTPEEEFNQVKPEEFLPRLKTPLVDLQIRVNEKQNPAVNFCAKTLEKMIEEPEHYQFLTEFLFAKYIKDKFDHFDPEEKITRENLSEKLKEALMEVGEAAQIAENQTQSEIADSEDGGDFTSEFEKTEFMKFISDWSNKLEEEGVEEDEIDSVTVDARIFFEDYLFEEKEISKFEDIRSGLFNTFLSGWYIRNISDQRADMELTLKNFDKLLKELEEQNLLTAEVLTKVSESLQDKDAFLNLTN